MAFSSYRPFWARIDLDAFRQNVLSLHTYVGLDKGYISVVKGNALGHGIVEISKAAVESGADAVAVAILDEAILLRKNGFDGKILILGYTQAELMGEVVRYGLEQTCPDIECAIALSMAAVQQDKMAAIHLKIDTGMHRLGFSADAENANIISCICKLPNLKVVGTYTHFSDPLDCDFTNCQLSLFRSFTNRLRNVGLPIGRLHAASSAAVLCRKDTYLDAVRPGFAQFGYPSPGCMLPESINLCPVMQLKACVVAIHHICPGDTVGYEQAYRADAERTIAVLPFGYGDGYPRLLQGKTSVSIHGKRANIIGLYCMDMCMVDITDIAEVKIGDEADVMGGEAHSLIELSGLSGIGPGELLNNIPYRVPRLFVSHGTVKVKKYYP